MPAALTIDTTAFVTFYSFKGGVGRSMALVNVAVIMAGRGFRVLALDMDLEAPGISYLLQEEANLGDQAPFGFVDLLSDACERGEEADLFALSPEQVVDRYSYPYTLPEPIRQSDEGLLRIMPAGKFDGHYQKKLDALDLGRLYQEGRGQPLIAAFKQVITSAEQFDFVFIDSRTGFSNESGICTRDLADYLVVILALNRQNQEGTAEFLTSLVASGAKPKGLRVVLSPVPNGEDDLVEERERSAQRTLSEAYGQTLDVTLQIPYHPRLALTEEPHIFRRSRGYLYEAYASIEEAVLDLLGLTVPILDTEVIKAVDEGSVPRALHQLRRMEKVRPGAVTTIAPRLPLEFLVQEDAAELRSYLAATVSPESGVCAYMAIRLKNAKCADAELFYERLIESAPNNADYLGDYAIFLKTVRGDQHAAEVLYKRAIDADPNHANNLGNYAIFLTNVLGDHDAAEALYKRALEANPNHANNLGNYAIFLTNVLSNHAAAEALYKRAINADPSHANNLGKYAIFLSTVLGDHDAAEVLYKRALGADPNHATNLGNYAVLLADTRGDLDAAEALHKRAINADPGHANNLGNYAKLLFLRGRRDDAIQKLETCLALDPQDPRLRCELYFYSYAHAPERYPEALTRLKELLSKGENSKGWKLDENVRVAVETGHPEPEFLKALADVISGNAGVHSLDAFPVWKKVAK